MGKKRTPPPKQTLDDAQPMPAPNVRPVMTPRQLAQFLQVSPRTIAREIREGRIPYVRVRKQVRFIPEDVLRHLRKSD
jgi:excisionase family DNA binding protein